MNRGGFIDRKRKGVGVREDGIFFFLAHASLRADEINRWLTNQSLVIVCTQASASQCFPKERKEK